ncbi:hypothetical protein NW765_017629 [Fusarium oxysporum]|nr:hypothetical protein NW765_017629 [Fusarium oxysporum]KAJ4264140.1 hypothetical protein NW764_015948 [Fusarium oxysporum]
MMKDIVGCCMSGQPAPDGYEPKGAFTRMGPVDVYTSKPGQNGRSDHVLLLLPDGYGPATHNIILADLYAAAGYQTIMPDYFEGDALPIQTLKTRATPEQIEEWRTRHPHDRVEELLDGLVASIRSAEPTIQILAVGYCFGGKHAFRMAKKHVTAAASFHPSFVVEDDIKDIRAPVFIGLAEEDDMVPETLAQDLETWTTRENVQAGFGSYPGVGHGFAARPATQDPVIREQYQRAFDAALTFFQKY